MKFLIGHFRLPKILKKLYFQLRLVLLFLDWA